jgi:hypothetical protein
METASDSRVSVVLSKAVIPASVIDRKDRVVRLDTASGALVLELGSSKLAEHKTKTNTITITITKLSPPPPSVNDGREREE